MSFRSGSGDPPGGRDDLLETVLGFMVSPTPAEARALIDDHPELLGDEADRLLSEMITSAGPDEEGYRSALESRRQLLRRARHVGVEKAFIEAGANVPTDPELSQLLSSALEASQRYAQTQDPTASLIAQVAWRQLLDHPALPQAPVAVQTGAANDAGNFFVARYRNSNDPTDLQQAIDAYQTALRLSPEGWPGQARYLDNLGKTLLLRWGQTGKREDREEAIAHMQLANQLHQAGRDRWDQWAPGPST